MDRQAWFELAYNVADQPLQTTSKSHEKNTCKSCTERTLQSLLKEQGTMPTKRARQEPFCIYILTMAQFNKGMVRKQ